MAEGVPWRLTDTIPGLRHYKLVKSLGAREIYEQGIVNPVFISGGGGGGGINWPPGGGGAGYATVWYTDNTARQDPLKPDLRRYLVTAPTPEERQDMAWTNPEAASIAREILADEKKEGLRETVTAAVQHFRDLLADAHCGSVFSFMKENDEGKHYFYAAVKNNDVWYTTAQNPRTIEGDDAFITWLIGLGAHESKAAELTVGVALELGPIDATSSDS